MTAYDYKTQNVCPTEIHFEIENGKLHNIRFNGGCPGNTAAVAKLAEGRNAEEVCKILKGNDCKGKGTSCADQLARAIEQVLNEEIS